MAAEHATGRINLVARYLDPDPLLRSHQLSRAAERKDRTDPDSVGGEHAPTAECRKACCRCCT
ncbi:hypothetical protein CHELA41_40118 [Hyphomicrobiales bacterium]|nr:hypothetical protein CHELA41_40118 [Hyphomicrobiales bacterium]